MCTGSRPKPVKTTLPPPPPPPPEATPTAPVIDGAAKDALLNRPKKRGLRALRIPLATGLNVPQG